MERALGGLLQALVTAYALGILACDAFGLGRDRAVWLGLHAVLALACLRGARTTGLLACLRGARTTGLLACGVALCAGAAAMARQQALPLPGPPRIVRLEARIAATGSAGGRAWLDLEQARVLGGEPLRGGIRLYLEDAALAGCAPGSWIRAQVHLSSPTSLRNPGARDRPRELARAGIAAQARLVDPALVAVWERPTSVPRLAPLRSRIAVRLGREGPGGALLAALAVGKREGLSADTRKALGRAGLAHLLAVSGLHLAALAGLAFLVLRRLVPAVQIAARGGDARLLSLGLAVGVAVFYAALTGFQLPVLRAGVFLGALLLGFWRGVPLPRGQVLALAAGVVLLLDPAAVFSPGAQLSFAATAGILFGGRDDGTVGGKPILGFPRRLLRATTAAVAATAPFVAWHFGGASPWGWLANLVAVPAVALFLLPSAACAAVLAVLAPVSAAPVIAVLARVAGVALEAAVGLAHAAAWGGASPPGPLGLALCGLLALLTLWTAWLPARVLLTVAALAVPQVAPPRQVQPSPPRVVFLNVGQGDATLLQSGAAAVLVDGGVAVPGGPDLGRLAVLPALRALGVERLDLVVASHADLDHQGGLRAILRAVPVARLWLPYGGQGDPAFRDLCRVARSRAVAVEERGLGGAALQLRGLRVVPLWPPRFPAMGSRNDDSLVLRVKLGALRVLLPGDLEAAGEAGLLATHAALGAELLKLPHHGSRTSSTCRFLVAVAPSLAVVSAPLHGRFGMPHAQVTRRLARLGIAMAWTGRDGAILVDALAPPPHRSALANKGALGLPRVLAGAQGRADLFLPDVGLGERQVQQLAHAGAGGADRQRRIRGNAIRHLEGSRQQLSRRDEAVQQPDLECARSADGPRRE